MLDIKAAYGPDCSGRILGKALVQVGGDLIEMDIFSRWLEGKHYRFNLVQRRNGVLLRVLRGWNEELVEVM